MINIWSCFYKYFVNFNVVVFITYLIKRAISFFLFQKYDSPKLFSMQTFFNAVQ